VKYTSRELAWKMALETGRRRSPGSIAVCLTWLRGKGLVEMIGINSPSKWRKRGLRDTSERKIVKSAVEERQRYVQEIISERDDAQRVVKLLKETLKEKDVLINRTLKTMRHVQWSRGQLCVNCSGGIRSCYPSCEYTAVIQALQKSIEI